MSSLAPYLFPGMPDAWAPGNAEREDPDGYSICKAHGVDELLRGSGDAEADCLTGHHFLCRRNAGAGGVSGGGHACRL